MNEPVTIDADTIMGIAEADTLSGDIRDALLTHVRAIRVPWAMLSEDEQQDTITAISHTAEAAVRRIAGVIAAQEMPHVVGTVNKFVVKNDVKVEFLVSSVCANIIALAEHGKTAAVLVLADASDFIGERAPAKPDPDQKSMPLDNAA
jgi:hypothetical protein